MAATCRACFATLVLVGLGCTSETPFEPLENIEFRRANPPSGMTVVAVAYNRIDGSWTDNSPNETGFELWRALAVNGTFELAMRVGANVTGFSDAGLSYETQYCYKARAYRITGNNTIYSEFSNTDCATTPELPVPAAPSGVNASPASSDVVRVTWTDNATDETGVRVEFSLNSGGTWAAAGSIPANNVSFYHYNRTAEQEVCYRIIAVNNFGPSAPSNTDCTIPPLGPDQLTASGVGSAIDLAWRDRSAVEEGYEVRRAEPNGQQVVVDALAANATSYHDVTMQPDTRYIYYVAAVRDGGYSHPASIGAIAVTSPPAAPVITSVTPQSSSSVALYWTEASQNVSGFRVESSPDELNWSEAGQTSWDQTAFWHGGLTADDRACYRVIAFNDVGPSAPSNGACATPPAAPTELTASPVVGFGIDLSWKDNSTVEVGYEVLQVVNYCSGGYYYYYYCYTYYVPVAVLQANSTSYSLTRLNPWEFYTFVVVAKKDGGSSSYSNEAGSYPGPQAP